ncbi:MAG: hypothetical protein ACXAEL_04785 [Candidatus Hodarchaeales archaeon]|jgi:hypothetical protein
MSPLFGGEFVVGIALSAWLVFGIFTMFMLAYLVLESGGNLWDLLWRSLVLVAIIPTGVILLTIPLITPVLLSGVMADLTEEQLQLASAAYVLFVASISLVCQFYYIRGLVREQLRDHHMTFFEYFRYLLHYRSKIREEEEEEKFEARARADVLFDKIETIKPVASAPKAPSEAAKSPTLDVYGHLPAFKIRWKWTLALSGIEMILFFFLMWIVPALVLWAGEPLPVLETAPSYYNRESWLFGLTALLFIPLLGSLVFLFFLGALTDIRMSETPLLVIAAPLVAIPLFFYSVHFILGFQNLRDITFLAILGMMLFVSCFTPAILFLAVFIGAGVGDWLLTGTTVHRFATRGRTLVLLVACTLAIILIFQLNSMFFPPEVDKGMIVLECMLFIALILGLAKIPLDEKLLVSVVAPLLVLGIWVLLAAPAPPLILVWLLAFSPLSVYFTDILDLDARQIRIKPVILAITLLIPLTGVWYLLAYFLVSDQAFLIVLLGISGTAIFFSIKLHLEPEEGIILSPMVTLAFVAALLVEGLLPRYKQLDDILLGNLVVLLFILLAASVLVGRKIRQDVLFIADDQHRLANKGERVLDDWMNRRNLEHEVHPNLAEDLSISFRVKCQQREYLIQSWPAFKGSDDRIRYHALQQKINESKIKVDHIHPNDLDFLDSRLEYILKGEQRAIKGN